jgi:hypothetical protein
MSPATTRPYVTMIKEIVMILPLMLANASDRLASLPKCSRDTAITVALWDWAMTTSHTIRAIPVTRKAAGVSGASTMPDN